MTAQPRTPEGIRVRCGRVARLVEDFAGFGALASGGVSRPCASRADGLARDRLGQMLREAGAEVRIDGVGNQFGLFRLAARNGRPAVMMGSHLDSQPRGGRIDGTLGVMAAVEIAELLIEARRGGQGFERDFCVVNWTNEEGARFRPSLMGSGVFAGHRTQAQALAACDDQGVSLADALSGIGYRGTDTPPPIPAIYLELHAEQAARLERHGVQIGLVTRNWGAVRLDLVFEGEQAHTGPTPMSDRRDALLAAARAVVALRALADSGPEGLHSSVGRLLVSPNSSNVVPDRVVLTAEVRAADDGVLGAAEEAMLRLIRDAAASANVEVGFASRSFRLGRSLPAGPVDFLEDCARAIGLPVMRLDTVAGHDALSFIGCCPTALVFVPSMNGLAHNEAERTRPEDMDAGAALMLEAAFRLCRGDDAAATPDMADAGGGSPSSRDRPHA